MQGSSSNKKRRNPEGKVSTHEKEDIEMNTAQDDTTSVDSQQRKIIKPKKKAQQAKPIMEEDGEEIEFEGPEKEFEVEDVVQRDDEQWEDVNSEESEDNEEMEAEEETKQEGKKVTFGGVQKKEIWDEHQQPLKEDEELVFDNSAYQMLHRAKVEWPCLSIDFLLRDRIGQTTQQGWYPQYLHSLNPEHSVVDKRGVAKHKKDEFPYSVYLCAGSQSTKKNENKIYVMKWSDMKSTIKDDEDLNDDVGSDDDENANNNDPIMRYEIIPHKGCVNRIRSMYGTNVVATWNDEAEVGIYDVRQALEALDTQEDSKQKKHFGGSKLSSFKHKDEGYALDWSPFTYGRLAAGCCNSQIYLYQAADESCSTFVKESQVGLQGHKGSVEDVQFSPSQEHVLASCSVDRTIKLWDLRATQMKSQMSFNAHDCDVNVISWNSTTKFLLASGDDKGEFKVWDLRMLSSMQNNEMESITRIRWHTAAITSLQFEPREESVLAVSSADNRVTLWDFSVEVDEAQQQTDDIPPQLMFLHQGQDNIKELRFHPQYANMIVTTAEDSYNIFKPNLDMDEDEEDKVIQGSNFYVDSEEEEDEEEKRMIKAAKKLSKDRNKKDGKRMKVEDDQ